MIISNLDKFTNGWIIGNFDPALLKTPDFEVCVKRHDQGEFIPVHTHKQSTEYNVLVSGKMIMNGKTILPNDIFIMEKGEFADARFLENCVVIVVKVPSIPEDKWTE